MKNEDFGGVRGIVSMCPFRISNLKSEILILMRGLGVAVVASCLCVSAATLQAQEPKPADKVDSTRYRLIIETDAGGDPDDEQSMVRFLVYVNEWDVEGIIVNRREVRDGENENKRSFAFMQDRF